MRRFECGAILAVLLALVACGKANEGDAKLGIPAERGAVRADSNEASGRNAGATDSSRALLFLGTSLTAGLGLEPDSAYPQQIQRLIEEHRLPFHAINAGVSGETSAGLLQRLDWVLQQPAAVIVVETGANDGLRGQPVQGTKATIGRILDRIRKERPQARVVLVQMEAPTNLGADYTRAFHAMFPELAEERGVVLMPFLLDSVAGVRALNQGDGVHPNLVGERIVTRHVWRTIGPILDSLAHGARAARR